jgi:hypothetical protein
MKFTCAAQVNFPVQSAMMSHLLMAGNPWPALKPSGRKSNDLPTPRRRRSCSDSSRRGPDSTARGIPHHQQLGSRRSFGRAYRRRMACRREQREALPACEIEEPLGASDRDRRYLSRHQTGPPRSHPRPGRCPHGRSARPHPQGRGLDAPRGGKALQRRHAAGVSQDPLSIHAPDHAPLRHRALPG